MDKPSAVIRPKTTEELAESLADEFMAKHYDNERWINWIRRTESELTTIKNRSKIKGWIWGFVAGAGTVILIFWR